MRRGLLRHDEDSGPLFEGATVDNLVMDDPRTSKYRLPARSDGPETSRLAAEEQLKSSKIAAQIQRVADLVRRLPGLNARELSARANDADPRTVGRRLCEAERLALIRRGPEKRDVTTGKLTTTWRPVEEL